MIAYKFELSGERIIAVPAGASIGHYITAQQAVDTLNAFQRRLLALEMQLTQEQKIAANQCQWIARLGSVPEANGESGGKRTA